MRKQPKQKILSLLLIILLLFQSLSDIALPVYGDDAGTNAYNHSVAYIPVTSLYTTVAHPSYVAKGGTEHAALQSFKLFDAKISVWSNVAAATRSDKGKAKTWLSNNNYLLNKFGCRNDSSYTVKLPSECRRIIL